MSESRRTYTNRQRNGQTWVEFIALLNGPRFPFGLYARRRMQRKGTLSYKLQSLKRFNAYSKGSQVFSKVDRCASAPRIVFRAKKIQQ